MPDADTTILALRQRIGAFVREREWEPFHNPKDLATAITIEASELLELFLWKDPQEVDKLLGQGESRNSIEQELADIIILCLSLANRLQMDVAGAVATKVAANEAKYPIDLVRGKAHKYTQYRDEL
jgi:NTP pyrophosphatase (non-canonical NTP hydrolase)